MCYLKSFLINNQAHVIRFPLAVSRVESVWQESVSKKLWAFTKCTDIPDPRPLMEFDVVVVILLFGNEKG